MGTFNTSEWANDKSNNFAEHQKSSRPKIPTMRGDVGSCSGSWNLINAPCHQIGWSLR